MSKVTKKSPESLFSVLITSSRTQGQDESEVLFGSVVSYSLQPMDSSLSGSSVHRNSMYYISTQPSKEIRQYLCRQGKFLV